jgi:hypothetical protein
MESEDESDGLPIDPRHQTIYDLFIQSYKQQGFFTFLLVDGTQDHSHVFQHPHQNLYPSWLSL